MSNLTQVQLSQISAKIGAILSRFPHHVGPFQRTSRGNISAIATGGSDFTIRAAGKAAFGLNVADVGSKEVEASRGECR